MIAEEGRGREAKRERKREEEERGDRKWKDEKTCRWGETEDPKIEERRDMIKIGNSS